MEDDAFARSLVAGKFHDTLARLRGRIGDDADDAFAQALALARLTSPPQTADDLYRFATMLVEWPSPGVIPTTGMALRVSAIMLGAVPLPRSGS